MDDSVNMPCKKPPLPHGWTVHVSKTYPDRVYYFNTISHNVTWDLPIASDNLQPPSPQGPARDTEIQSPEEPYEMLASPTVSSSYGDLQEDEAGETNESCHQSNKESTMVREVTFPLRPAIKNFLDTKPNPLPKPKTNVRFNPHNEERMILEGTTFLAPHITPVNSFDTHSPPRKSTIQDKTIKIEESYESKQRKTHEFQDAISTSQSNRSRSRICRSPPPANKCKDVFPLSTAGRKRRSDAPITTSPSRILKTGNQSEGLSKSSPIEELISENKRTPAQSSKLQSGAERFLSAMQRTSNKNFNDTSVTSVQTSPSVSFNSTQTKTMSAPQLSKVSPKFVDSAKSSHTTENRNVKSLQSFSPSPLWTPGVSNELLKNLSPFKPMNNFSAAATSIMSMFGSPAREKQLPLPAKPLVNMGNSTSTPPEMLPRLKTLSPFKSSTSASVSPNSSKFPGSLNASCSFSPFQSSNSSATASKMSEPTLPPLPLMTLSGNTQNADVMDSKGTIAATHSSSASPNSNSQSTVPVNFSNTTNFMISNTVTPQVPFETFSPNPRPFDLRNKLQNKAKISNKPAPKSRPPSVSSISSNPLIIGSQFDYLFFESDKESSCKSDVQNDNTPPASSNATVPDKQPLSKLPANKDDNDKIGGVSKSKYVPLEKNPPQMRGPLQIRDLLQTRDPSKVIDPQQTRDPLQIRDLLQTRDPSKVIDPQRTRDPLQTRERLQTRDSPKVRDPQRIRDPPQTREQLQTRDSPQVRDPQRIRDPPQTRERLQTRDSPQVRDPRRTRERLQTRDPPHASDSPNTRGPLKTAYPPQKRDLSDTKEPLLKDKDILANMPKMNLTSLPGWNLQVPPGIVRNTVAESCVRSFGDHWGEADAKEDVTEAMDWEPTPSDVPEDTTSICSLDVQPSSSKSDGKWHVVVDTNILLHDLSFLEDLRDSLYTGRGETNIIIPWIVFQELDSLKDRSKERSKSTKIEIDQPTMNRARAAVSFIHTNLMSNHPRLQAQSLTEYGQYKYTGCEKNDDKIIHYCSILQKKGCQVTLLTNDKNLSNKAIASRIEALSKVELQRGLSKCSAVKNLTIPIPDTKQNQNNSFQQEEVEADKIFCQTKIIIHEVLKDVLKMEMKREFKGLWTRMVVRKPPWTLDDVFVCFKKHWMSVFSNRLPRNTLKLVEDLEETCHTNKMKKGFDRTLNDVKDFVETSRTLMMCVSNVENLSTKIQNATSQLDTMLRLCNSHVTPIANTSVDTYIGSAPNAMFKVESDQMSTTYIDEPVPVKDKESRCQVVQKVLEDTLNLIHSFCEELQVFEQTRKSGDNVSRRMQERVESQIGAMLRHAKLLSQLNKKLLEMKSVFGSNESQELHSLLLAINDELREHTTNNVTSSLEDDFTVEDLCTYYKENSPLLKEAQSIYESYVSKLNYGIKFMMEQKD